MRRAVAGWLEKQCPVVHTFKEASYLNAAGAFASRLVIHDQPREECQVNR